MPDVDKTDLSLYRRRWVRTVLDTYSFGMYTVMVILTFYYMFKRGNVWTQHRVTLCYTIFMLCVTVGWYYSQTRMDEAESIETLAGSAEVSVGDSCTPLDYISNTLSLLQFWGNDVLMLSRAYTIFNNRLLVVAFPTAMFFTFVGLGIPLLVSCAPRVILINPTAIVIAHYSLSAILNFMVTAMIAAKLLFHQRQLKQHNVSSNVYISAVGILAESAVLYSTSLIVYVILVARNSPATIWFSAVIMSASFLSQAWIILRVSMGTTYIREGWSHSLTAVPQSGRPPGMVREPMHHVFPSSAGGITTSVTTYVKRDSLDTGTSIALQDISV